MDAQTCTLTEAAAVFRIDPTTAYRLANEGKFPIPVLTIGRSKRVSIRQLEDFVDPPVSTPTESGGEA